MRRTSTNHLPPDCGQRRLAPRPNQQALHGPPPGSAVGPSSEFEASTLGFDQFAFDPATISDLDSEPQFFNQCVLDDVHLDSALWTGFNATPFPVQNWDEPAAAAAHLQSRPLNGLVSDVNDLGNISSFHEPSVSELGFTPLSPVSAAHSHAQQSNLVTPQSYAITSPGEIGSAYSGSPPAWSPSSFSDSVASAISQSSVASPRVAVCKYCGKSFRRGCELREHEKTHTRPYLCDLCLYRCATRRDLKRHKEVYHLGPQSSTQCTVCDKMFTRADACMRHMKHEHTKTLDLSSPPINETGIHEAEFSQNAAAADFPEPLDQTKEPKMPVPEHLVEATIRSIGGSVRPHFDPRQWPKRP